MPLQQKSQSSRIEILDAALDLVRSSGAFSLTIDAVAEKSGFSKGGVLYNFPTKDALIRAMVQLLADRFSQDIETARAGYPESDSPTVMGMIDVTESWVQRESTVARAMLVTTLCDAGHIEPFLELKRRLKLQIEAETSDRPRDMAIWAALEGIHFSTAHGVSVHSDEDRRVILNELRGRLADRETNQNGKSRQ
ncbi:TetR/AcrR family transcriptional regulator [Roseibium sp.]|uniref:TetR/AcrR family transcriptional regulator n=1 Tax=Roseibium sp. TaxID=1936156 RepID=UPI003A987697